MNKWHHFSKVTINIAFQISEKNKKQNPWKN